MIDYVQIGYSASGHSYCLVMTDHFTKYAVAVPTIDQTAESAAEAVCKHFIQVFGCPKRIHSDQGACFQGTLMTELYQLYGIERSRTTPYHPQGNGTCERFNRTLLQMLRTLEDSQKARWPEYLPELMWAYNNRVHSTTGYSPHMLMFGRAGREIEDLHMPDPMQPPPRNTTAWAQEHRRRLRAVHKVVGERLKQVVHPNPRPVQKDEYAPGDRVMVKAKKPTGKLDGRWEAIPYVVKRRVDPAIPVYEVEPVGNEGPSRNLHRNMLRRCTFEEPKATEEVPIPTLSTVETPLVEEWWVVPVPGTTEVPSVISLPPREGVAQPASPPPINVLEVPDPTTLRRTTRSNAGVPPQRYAQEEFVWEGLPRTSTSSGVACEMVKQLPLFMARNMYLVKDVHDLTHERKKEFMTKCEFTTPLGFSKPLQASSGKEPLWFCFVKKKLAMAFKSIE
ncbi:uncharacterized protein ACNLHF_019304 [Anomaloglossus baeobatrachus]